MNVCRAGKLHRHLLPRALVIGGIILLGACQSSSMMPSQGAQVAPVGSMQQRAAQFDVGHFQSAHRASPDGIVYTPANVQIENSTYDLDLNNDKITDFVISESNWRQTCDQHPPLYESLLQLDTQGSNGVEGFPSGIRRLVSGSPIGPSQSFVTGLWGMEAGFYGWMGTFGGCVFVHDYKGNWPPGNSGYLGLTLVIGGQTHYGWAAITVGEPRNGWLSATLTGYAYQTIAGKSIKAGQM